MTAAKRRRVSTPREPARLGGAIDRKARQVLIEARVAAALTQYELAGRLGRPPSYVSKIEHGPRAVSRTDFVAIARALGEDAHSLFAKAIAGSADRSE